MCLFVGGHVPSFLRARCVTGAADPRLPLAGRSMEVLSALRPWALEQATQRVQIGPNKRRIFLELPIGHACVLEEGE